MVKEVASLPDLQVEGIAFSPVVTPPGSSKGLFLAGAGERGLEINGQFIVFTAIGIYLEDEAVPTLAAKWKGKTAEQLAGDSDFFRDIFAGSFEKLTRITMVKPLTGQMYSEKVSENCIAQWKAAGIYTDAECAAVEKFKAAFAAETFHPGSSILFTHHPSPASLTIAFSKDGSATPATASAVIENKALSEAVLESIIGEHGVSAAAKRSLALRLSELLNGVPQQAEEAKTVAPLSVSV